MSENAMSNLFAGIYGCGPVGRRFEFTVSNLSITNASTAILA
jgi:hypothetical protein